MPCTTPMRLTLITHCQSLRLTSQTKPPPAATPALLKRRCAAPNFSTVWAASCCTSAALETSARTPRACAPEPRASATASSSASCCTSASTSFIRSLAPMRANSLPKPLPAPVMTATLPARSFIADSSGPRLPRDPEKCFPDRPPEEPTMDFTYSQRTRELLGRVQAFMDEHVYPTEERFFAEVEENRRKGNPWVATRAIEELKEKARGQGLWNLFLPDSEYGAGRCNLECAPLCAIMGDPT